MMAGHDNWLTPPDLFHLLDREFAFDLDAAAARIAEAEALAVASGSALYPQISGDASACLMIRPSVIRRDLTTDTSRVMPDPEGGRR